MSLANIIVWPSAAENLTTIASTQTVAAGGSLVLNGNVPSFGGSPTLTVSPYVYKNMARSVSITSTANLSGETVTIYGLGSIVDANYNPIDSTLTTPLTVVVTGPNNDTVDSIVAADKYIFTQINSVVSSGAAANISIGFGGFGITTYVFTDYNRKAWNATCSAQILSNSGSLEYTAWVSLNKPAYANTQGGVNPFVGGQIPAFTLEELNTLTPSKLEGTGTAAGATEIMVAANDTQIAQIPSTVATVWFSINDDSFVADNNAIFTVLQQSIT